MRSDETLDRWKKRSGRKCEVWWKARNTDNKLKLVERLKQKALFLVFLSSQFPRFSPCIFFRTSHSPHSSFSRHSLSYYFLPHSEFSTLWSTIFSQIPHFIPHSSFSALCLFLPQSYFFHTLHFLPQSSFSTLCICLAAILIYRTCESPFSDYRSLHFPYRTSHFSTLHIFY